MMNEFKKTYGKVRDISPAELSGAFAAIDWIGVAVLFGSRAKPGKASVNSRSDYDFAVSMDKSIPAAWGHIARARVEVSQALELADLIDQPQQADRTFWTAKAFHGYISGADQIECSNETVVRFFHKQGYALKMPQPWPDRQDEQLREVFLKELKQLLKQPDVDIWFADESGFEGDPRPRKRWDKKGRKTRVTKNGDHLRMNVIGMVCPRTGQFFAIEASHSDSVTYQAFLDEYTDKQEIV